MSIATVARQAGHDVVICDLNVARRRGELPDTEDWHRAGAEHLLALDPEIVGLGTVCSSFAATILVCQALKAQRPSLPVVLGGPQATLVYRDLLEAIPEIDFVLTGEADHTFTQLLDTLDRGGPIAVPGLAQRVNGSVVLAPAANPVDMDALPMPDYGLWPFREVLDDSSYEDWVPIDDGRGCPYRCSFCSTSQFFRRKYRMKSPSRVSEEMTSLYRTYGFAHFELTHDAFTAD